MDELENRRLLCCTLLGGSLERSFQHDDFETEDRFETEEGDDLPRTATWGRVAIVDSHDAEGEDDGWEDETEFGTYAIPTTPVKSNQLPVDTVIAFGVGNAFWLGRVVVLDASGTRDDDSAENATPAINIARTANGSDKTIAASPTRTTNDGLDEGESSAPQTDVRTDREPLQPSGVDGTVTSQSPAPTGLADLVAATANPMKETAGTNLDPSGAVSPPALPTRSTQGEGTRVSGDGDTSWLEPVRTTAGGSSDTLELSSLRLDGPTQDPLTAAGSTPRHTLRHGEPPGGYHHDPHPWALSALAPDSQDVGDWRLRDALSQDLAALETALQDLLADSGEMGKDMADWLMRPDVIPWTLAATIALVAAEIVRRKTQRPRSNGLPPPPDAADVSLRLFPELLGLPPGTRP